MNEMEMIEKLKKNKTAFGLLFNDERECFIKVGLGNCLYYDGKDFVQPKAHRFFPEFIYAINPDYQPEPPKPEPMDCEIVEVDKLLGIVTHGYFQPLYKLPSLPNFCCFWFLKKNAMSEIIEVSYSRVSKARDEGRKVYARFRTE
jgi:hypothetical protein